MPGYLRRLLRTGAAYQASDIVSKVIALALLPVYTRALTRADYGTAELLLTTVILVSIVARLGLGEAFLRFYFLDEDALRRRRVARMAVLGTLATTTLIAGAAALAAAPLSEWLLGDERPRELRAACLGIWAFTNLEIAYALLRAEERTRTYLTASLTNVALTVVSTVVLVVALDQGAFGLLLGNFGASAVVLVVLWIVLRDRFAAAPGARAELREMLRYGAPTVPAEVSVFAIFFVDRIWLYRLESEAAAGLYALAVKLAAAVIFTVRAFQLAWPPLAYSITDDAEARRVYARIATAYAAVTGGVVLAMALLGRWVVRLFAAPEFFEAHEALPWVALGWALYGLFLVLVAMAGRAQVTVRNAPAALIGLGANVVALAVLVPALGTAGAGIALCVAYLVMLVAMYAFTRDLFRVDFEWARLGAIVAVLACAWALGELAFGTDGAGPFAARAAVLAVAAAGLLEIAGVRRLLAARR
jgi:O-antigen/teichoic acid export membrane protein